MNWLTKEGFKEIFVAYYNPLCNYVYSIMQSDLFAEDIVHDVFVHLWNNRKKIKVEEKSLKSFLFKSTRNKALEKIRSNKSKLKNEGVFSALKEQNEVNLSHHEDLMILREILKRSVRQLPTKCKDVYLLRTQNGLTFAEIAEHLDISQRTVENQMYTAIQKLRELVNEQRKIYNTK